MVDRLRTQTLFFFLLGIRCRKECELCSTWETKSWWVEMQMHTVHLLVGKSSNGFLVI